MKKGCSKFIHLLQPLHVRKIQSGLPGTLFQSIPGNAFFFPSIRSEEVILLFVCCVIVASGSGVGVVLPVERNAFGIIGIPADSLIFPANRDQIFLFRGTGRVMVVTSILVVQAVNWR